MQFFMHTEFISSPELLHSVTFRYLCPTPEVALLQWWNEVVPICVMPIVQMFC